MGNDIKSTTVKFFQEVKNLQTPSAKNKQVSSLTSKINQLQAGDFTINDLDEFRGLLNDIKNVLNGGTSIENFVNNNNNLLEKLGITQENLNRLGTTDIYSQNSKLKRSAFNLFGGGAKVTGGLQRFLSELLVKMSKLFNEIKNNEITSLNIQLNEQNKILESNNKDLTRLEGAEKNKDQNKYQLPIEVLEFLITKKSRGSNLLEGSQIDQQNLSPSGIEKSTEERSVEEMKLELDALTKKSGTNLISQNEVGKAKLAVLNAQQKISEIEQQIADLRKEDLSNHK
jgi:hypothetical protein